MNDIEMRFDDNIIIGGAGEVQEKTVTPDAAGQIVRPDTGYDALSKVIVNGDADLVPENVKDGVNIFGVTGNYDNRKPEQEKVVTPTPQGSEILPDSGKVLSKVTVQGDKDLVAENVKKDVEIFGVVGTYDNRLPEQVKTAIPTTSGVEVLPDAGKTLSRVNIPAEPDLVPGKIKAGVDIFGVVGEYETPTEEKSVTPEETAQEITPSSGKHISKVTVAGATLENKEITPDGSVIEVTSSPDKYGLRKVTVAGDANLVAENIKAGESIYGVTGTYETPTEEKSATPGTQEQEITPAAGKHLSKVTVAGDADLIAGNIKKDVNIFGVVGTMEGQKEEQVKTVDADPAGLEVVPDTGKALSKVIINAIANLIASNIKKDITILGVTGTYEPTVETQEKSATPGAQAVEVTPDAGKYLSKVTVQGDANLVASNIKKDVNVFGVTGTYEGTETNFATFVEGTTGTIQIPAVTTIRNTCFQNQKHNYLIPGTVESIGDYAFDGCSGMTRLVLPAGLASLGAYAFRNCKNIESDVIIPEAINNILGAVFYGCSKITRFEFKSTFTGSGNSIQPYAFYNCTNCLVYDFTAAEAVPALPNINAFNNHNADLRIIVPDALYNDWIAATNWSNSNISEHIVKASEA